MKRFMFAIVVLGLVITAFVFADMSHTIKSRPTAYWWHSGASYSTDPARMWAYEVEDILEGIETCVAFNGIPVTAKIGGGAATGTAGDENCLIMNGDAFEYHILGTQTILSPVPDANGLDISMDQTADDGVEITQGITAGAKHAYTIGTDACYLKVKFVITDVSGTDDCAVGFRKAELYQANIDDYNDIAVLNVISKNITIETIDDNGATAPTDTLDDWEDYETKTLEVRIDSAGAVTYKIDGANPTTTAAHTIDSGDVVVPFFYFLQHTDLAEKTALIEWECGKL